MIKIKITEITLLLFLRWQTCYSYTAQEINIVRTQEIFLQLQKLYHFSNKKYNNQLDEIYLTYQISEEYFSLVWELLRVWDLVAGGKLRSWSGSAEDSGYTGRHHATGVHTNPPDGGARPCLLAWQTCQLGWDAGMIRFHLVSPGWTPAYWNLANSVYSTRDSAGQARLVSNILTWGRRSWLPRKLSHKARRRLGWVEGR